MKVNEASLQTKLNEEVKSQNEKGPLLIQILDWTADFYNAHKKDFSMECYRLED